jgi:hypothetical protein
MSVLLYKYYFYEDLLAFRNSVVSLLYKLHSLCYR